MPTGKYGGAQTVDVSTGDKFRVDGRHTFWCGDVLEVADEIPIMDIVYTDPPWNDAIQRNFWKYAGREDPHGFTNFLNRLIELIAIKCPAGVVVLEMGARGFPQMEAQLESRGGRGYSVEATYGAAHTVHKIWVGRFGNGPLPAIPAGLHSKQTIRTVVDTCVSAEDAFFDPCCGQLEFCRPAIEKGATVHGAELIPAKLAKGLSALAKKYTVEKL